jgi:hypothetical protein
MASLLPLLYLDTTIPSAYYNERQRERQMITQRAWHEKLPNYHLVISNITLKELGATPNRKKRKKLIALVYRLDTRVVTPTCKALAKEYLRAMNIPEEDALHIAIATVFVCEILLSWNFKHMVNYSNKQTINSINLSNGYKPIAIISPFELRD